VAIEKVGDSEMVSLLVSERHAETAVEVMKASLSIPGVSMVGIMIKEIGDVEVEGLGEMPPGDPHGPPPPELIVKGFDLLLLKLTKSLVEMPHKPDADDATRFIANLHPMETWIVRAMHEMLGDNALSRRINEAVLRSGWFEVDDNGDTVPRDQRITN
jgi:hypothetical protein